MVNDSIKYHCNDAKYYDTHKNPIEFEDLKGHLDNLNIVEEKPGFSLCTRS